MRYKAAIAAMLSGSALLLAACDGEPDAATPTEAATGEATEAVVPDATPSGDATGEPDGAVVSDLDLGALSERQDPERLLRFYTNALRTSDWQAAARAWSLDAQMTPEKISAQFGGGASPKIAVGKGDASAAAGTLFYEAPIVVTFADGRPANRGTIVLRRVNGPAAASEQQLFWRIERTSTVDQ
jgi:hypothetical protein